MLLTAGAQQVPIQPKIDATKVVTVRIMYTTSTIMTIVRTVPRSSQFISPVEYFQTVVIDASTVVDMAIISLCVFSM